MLSFKEFEVTRLEDIAARVERHTAQSGSVFEYRADSLKLLKTAEDEVKRVMAQVEMDTHILGSIPVDGVPTIKITGASMKAFVDCHPDVIKARKERAEAFKAYDTARALAQAYLDVKEFLQLLMRNRNNEFYSEPKNTASGLPDYLSN